MNIVPRFQSCPHFLSYSSKTSRSHSSLALKKQERGGLRNLPCLFCLDPHLAPFRPLDLKVPPKQKAIPILPRKRRETTYPSKGPSSHPWCVWGRASPSSELLGPLYTICLRINGLPTKIAHAWASVQVYQTGMSTLITCSLDSLVHIRVWEPLGYSSLGVEGQACGVVVAINIWMGTHFYVKVIIQGSVAHGPRATCSHLELEVWSSEQPWRKNFHYKLYT